MKELMKVRTNGGKEIAVIDSREVAIMMGKSHGALLKDLQGSKDGKSVGIIPTLTKSNFDLVNYFIESSYIDAKGEIRKCYLVTKMGCEMLGNKQQGEKGILFTAKYVERFNQYEEQLKELTQPKLPTSYKEALLELIKAEEEKERLEAENRMLIPKAKFYDDVAGSKDAISIGEVAKILGIRKLGRNKLFQLLRDKKILQPNNQPYQQFVDKGYFRIIEQRWTTENGETKINIKTLVYQKGLDYIRRIIKEN